ncbi:MAG: hypothetical protein ABMA64_03760 [Myxococcota bacterium]
MSLFLFAGMALANEDVDDWCGNGRIPLPGPKGDLPLWWFDERIGVSVVFGVTGGGGGAVFVPGKGFEKLPDDLDHPNYTVTVDSFPVAFVAYADERELGSILDGAYKELDAAGIRAVELTDVESALGAEGVALVTPKDEASAVQWVLDNSAEFCSASHVTLVLLELDGKGFAQIGQ